MADEAGSPAYLNPGVWYGDGICQGVLNAWRIASTAGTVTGTVTAIPVHTGARF